MTKEEILKAYLSDDLFVQKKYLKQKEVDLLKWSDRDPNKLVTVIKLAIEGENSGEGSGVTIRKINQLLNKES